MQFFIKTYSKNSTPGFLPKRNEKISIKKKIKTLYVVIEGITETFFLINVKIYFKKVTKLA